METLEDGMELIQTHVIRSSRGVSARWMKLTCHLTQVIRW